MTYENSLAFHLLCVLAGLFSPQAFQWFPIFCGYCRLPYSWVSPLLCLHPESQRFLLAQHPQVLFGKVPLSFLPKGLHISQGEAARKMSTQLTPRNTMLQVSKTHSPSVMIHVYTFVKLRRNIKEQIFYLIPNGLGVTA